MNQNNPQEVLAHLNETVRQVEFNRDVARMNEILSDELIFRRADGTVQNKAEYMKRLADKNNSYSSLENMSMKIEIKDEKFAIATVMVKASGKREEEQKSFEGVFKNTRYFLKNGDWKLYFWHNERSETLKKETIITLGAIDIGSNTVKVKIGEFRNGVFKETFYKDFKSNLSLA